jgi:hypothetical protein
MILASKTIIGSDMKNATLTKHNPAKQSYSTLESVMQEVVLAEQSSLEIMCSLLEKENIRYKSKVISVIISLLKDWNTKPSSEIQEKAIALLRNQEV